MLYVFCVVANTATACNIDILDAAGAPLSAGAIQHSLEAIWLGDVSQAPAVGVLTSDVT